MGTVERMTIVAPGSAATASRTTACTDRVSKVLPCAS
jgi:hypothetical protein